LDEVKPTILIVEDDLDIADMLNAYFRVQGYDVLTVNWGEDGVRAALSNNPNLIILDIRLPDIDGFEVARRLRANRKTKTIPIIFLTEKRDRTDKLKGLELQADDYITKPFDIQELRLRVRNAMQRAKQNSLTNSITGLPEGGLVDEALEGALGRGTDALLVISLRNLDRFREVYGFVAADDLLRAVSIMLRDAARDSAAADDFIGHISPTDFVILCHPGNATALKERARRRLEQSFEYFYSDQHREAGTFAGHVLAVQLGEIRLASARLSGLTTLKSELESYCR
jgi:PleD family two-component response regulator